MDLDLSGKNALVCGSSKGIGRAAAKELALLGANVTLAARSAEQLSMVAANLDQSIGQDHDFLVVDLQDIADVKRKVSGLVSGKPIHILVNNTGGPPAGPIVEARPDDFLQAYERHLIASHLLVQAVLPGMRKEGYGRIINVISTSVKAPLHNLGVSNTTRAAVANWAKTLANELGPHGVTVNNVLPGLTRTGRLEEIMENSARKTGTTVETVSARMQAAVPLGRIGEPRETGAAIAFLASPAAAYIHGINLPVDGGRTPSL